MPAPIFFDLVTLEFKRFGGTNRVDDVVLPSTVVRTNGTTPFVAAQSGEDPTADAHLTTQRAVRRFINELGSWWGPVESAAVLNPVALTPTVDQRWLVASPGAGAWAGHSNQLATWRGAPANWVFATPAQGTTVYNRNLSVYLVWNGSAWVHSVLHQALSDLQGGSAGQYYHLTSTQHTALTSSQVMKLFLATPTNAAGVPGMRALTLADLPVGSNGQSIVTVGSTVSWATLDAGDVGAVPTSRTVTAGTGLTGGGALSSNLTLTWSGLGVALRGSTIGTRRSINIISEAAVTDDSDAGKVDIELPDAILYAMIFGR